MDRPTQPQGALTGRVAVVTGAGSGVGQAIALALAAEGATLCLLGRDVAKLEATAAAATTRRTARAHATFSVDMGETDWMPRFSDALVARFGGVDILVHSAGTLSRGGVEASSIADFDEQYRVNVRGVFALTQQLLPCLVDRSGEVVLINSSVAITPGRAELGGYTVTKSAQRAIADTLRQEVNGRDVRVLSLFLGQTATPMQEALYAAEGKPYDPTRLMQPEDVGRVVVAALTMPRSAEITDVSLRPMTRPPTDERDRWADLRRVRPETVLGIALALALQN